MPCCCLEAQESVKTGRIISEDFDVLPEVKISNQNGELLGKTDINGRFKITIPDGESVLKISFIGMEPTEIELSKDCDVLEVVMMVEAIYDFISLKKVDRLRKKRFKKLPQIHKEAFNQGLFKTKTACYKQEFIYYSR